VAASQLATGTRPRVRVTSLAAPTVPLLPPPIPAAQSIGPRNPGAIPGSASGVKGNPTRPGQPGPDSSTKAPSLAPGFPPAGRLTVFASLLALSCTAAEPTAVVHRLSPAIREAITEALPKYAPPTVASSGTAGAATNSPDVLQLPKMTVRTRRVLRMEGYEFLSPKGRVEMARKMFPGLGFGPLSSLNNGIAMAMLQEEIDLENREALSDLAKRTSLVNSPGTRATDREMEKAVVRPNADWASGLGRP